MDNTVIKYIFIFPRNKRYVSYLINNSNELHALKYENMYKFLCKYINPPNTIKVRKLLYSFRKIFVDIENQEIIELTIDQENEIKKIKDKHFKFDLNKIIKDIYKLKDKNIDNDIKKYSNIDMNKLYKNIYLS